MRRFHREMLRSVCVIAIMAPTAVYAQASAYPQAVPNAADPAATALDTADKAATAPDTTQSGTATDIIVTGSRIQRAGFQSPTPVNVVTTDDLIKKAPGSLADGLNQLPVFQNSVNANQQQFTQGNRQRTGNYLNLRSLGAQRVLVLQDGQRLPPTGTNGGVDSTLVPQLLTERIDVVTGGASAAYGSDAVSGVVNFITNKHFTGLKAQGQRGFSTRGDNGSYRVGVAVGGSFFDNRLHLIGSIERNQSDGLEKTDRPIIAQSYQAAGAGTAASPFLYVDDVRFGNVSEGGFIQTGPAGVKGLQFGANGQLVPFNVGIPSGNPGTQRGGDGALIGQACCTITPSQSANQLFGRAEYEFSPSITGFLSVGYNTSTNSDNPIPIFRTQLRIYNDNAFLQPAVRTALVGTPFIDIGKIFNDHRGNAITQWSSSLNVLAGLNGNLGSSFKWNVNYSHGETDFHVSNIDTVNSKLYAAIDAVRDSAGNVVCRVTLINPGLYTGCIPLNPFGVGNETQAAYDYVLGESRYKAINKLDSFQASITGDILQLPAGPLSFALGGEYRRQSLDQTSNSDPAVAPDFTGLRGIVSTGSLTFQNLNQGLAKGAYTIKEAFGELDVPVLKDSFAGTLSLNGALRVTNYSTSGTVTTWKVGGVYDPLPGLRLRATMSRDIRAPSLYELFAGQTSTAITFSDVLTGTQASSRQISGGNANLTPEIARTFTGGIVVSPRFLAGFNFSADYFNIKIKDAIATPFSAFQIVDLCAASNYTSTLCSQIVRPLGPTNTSAANQPTAIFTNNQNVATLGLSGIDFEMSYVHRVGEGRLSLRALATRQLTFDQQTAAGQANLSYVGTADFNDVQFPLPLPKWRGSLSLGYDTDHFSASVQERYIGGYDRSHLQVFADSRVGAVGYTDASVTFKVPLQSGGQFELFATANNLLDRDAPLLPVTRTPGLTVPTMRSTYDIIGRYVTIGARVNL